MRKREWSFATALFVSLLVVAGFTAGPASSQGGGDNPPPLPDDYVPDLSEAPPGLPGVPDASCAGDPDQPRCGIVYMVVAPDGETAYTSEGTYTLPDDWVQPDVDLGPQPGARRTERNASRRPGASLFADDETGYGPLLFGGGAGYQCYVRTEHPTRPNGSLIGRGRNICGYDPNRPVYATDIVEQLWVQGSNGSWNFKKQNDDHGSGVGRIDVTASINCGNRNVNFWGTKAYSAANLGGVVYAGQNPENSGYKKAYVDCGGT